MSARQLAGTRTTADSSWAPCTVVAAVDALHDRRDLSDDEWAELARHLDERELIELVMLVGHYEMLATTIATLRIAPDQRRG